MKNLRKKAEELYKKKSIKPGDLSELELHKLIEELQIHQIELQVQNDELRESREENEAAKKKYFNLFDLAPIGYMVLDKKGIVTECNLKATEIFGRRKNHIFNKPFVSFLDAISMSKFYEYFEYAQHNRLHEEFELVIQKQKTKRYLQVAISLFTDNQYLMVLSDITEKKQIEQKLKDSEERFRLLINSTSDIVFTLDTEQKHSGIYGDWTEKSGLTKDYFLGKTAEELMGDEAKVHTQANNRALNGETVTYEWKSIQGNNVKYYQTSLTPLKNKGEITGIIGVGRDISMLKQTEKYLLKAKETAEEKELQLQQQKVEITLNNDRLESLLRISQLRTDSIQELLDFALEEAINLTASKIGYIYFYNEETKQFSLNTWSKEVMKECAVMNPQTIYDLDKTGCWGEAVRQRKPIIFNDYMAEHPHKKGTPKGHVQLNKFLTIPVIIDNEVVAVAGVANKKEDYNEADIRQLSLLMDSVWKISERISFIQKLKDINQKLRISEGESKERLKELNGIYNLGLITSDIKDLDSVLNTIVKIIIPESMQFSDNAYVLLKIGDTEYTNIENFNLTGEQDYLSSPIKRYGRKSGELIVAYTAKLPFIDVHEQKLIDTYAIRISSALVRYQSEKVLKESEKKFRNLVGDMQVGVLLQGPNAEILLSNLKALELLGLTEDQLLGKTSFDPDWNVIHEDGSPFPGEMHPVPEAIAIRKPVRNVIMGVYRPQTKDRVWLLVDAEPQFNENDTIKQIVCSFIDISERKKAEKNLRESQMQLQKITDNLPVLISQIDNNLKYTFVNKEYEKVLNAKKEDIIGQDINKFLNPDFHKRNRKYISKALKGEKVVYETKLSDKNNKMRFYLTTLIPNINNQKPEGYFALIIDRTDAKKYEEKLKELNATKDKFFRIIAHDLRIPFSSILGFSNLLVENIDRYDNEKIKDFVNNISQVSNSTFKLLENLLDWSRSQSGLHTMKLENHELKNLVDEIIVLHKNMALAKNISIKNQIPDDTCIYADKNMINTVFRNLITNALKFTHKSGSIAINAISLNHEIEISVSDTGVGLNNNTKNKLFKITEKVSTTGTENEKGTGLGLILCKEFIEKHNGKIWVDSEDGKGSVFSFSIPSVK